MVSHFQQMKIGTFLVISMPYYFYIGGAVLCWIYVQPRVVKFQQHGLDSRDHCIKFCSGGSG